MANGWIKLHRATLDHPLLRKHDARGLWAELLLRASVMPTRVQLRGCPVALERGQVACVLTDLAERGGMTRKRMRLIMDSWVADGMLKLGQAKGRAFSIVTICNFDVWQSQADIEGPSSGPEKGQGGAKEGPTEQEGKEGRERENQESPAPAAPADLRKELWAQIVDHAGGNKRRSLVGRWFKDYGNGAVIEAHFDALKAEPVDYVSWMNAALAARARKAAAETAPPRPTRVNLMEVKRQGGDLAAAYRVRTEGDL